MNPTTEELKNLVKRAEFATPSTAHSRTDLRVAKYTLDLRGCLEHILTVLDSFVVVDAGGSLGRSLRPAVDRARALLEEEG